LAKSESFEIFLTQQSHERFEQQQKTIKDTLLGRKDKEITEFITKQCYPDIDFGDIEEQINYENIENEADRNVYMEQIPRIREVYMRCDEKFVAMNKMAQNIHKIFTNIVTEINTLNDQLYGLYDIEKNEKPEIMKNELMEKEEICSFITKWKTFEQNQMYCYYKYWLLNLKYEHQDCLAILDVFVRYDIVYNKYKKIKDEITNSQTSKDWKHDNNENRRGVQVEESDEKKEDGIKCDVKEEDLIKDKIKNIKFLLDAVCKIILKEQIPKLWNKKAEYFNKQMKQFSNKVVQYSLDDNFV